MRSSLIPNNYFLFVVSLGPTPPPPPHPTPKSTYEDKLYKNFCNTERRMSKREVRSVLWQLGGGGSCGTQRYGRKKCMASSNTISSSMSSLRSHSFSENISHTYLYTKEVALWFNQAHMESAVIARPPCGILAISWQEFLCSKHLILLEENW
jgi:hypothetical protein